MGKRKPTCPPLPPIPDDAPEVICTECGSHEVQYAIWFDPNTQRTYDLFGSWNAGDNTFCVECDINGRDPNPPLVDKNADDARYRVAYAKRENKE